MRKLTTLTGDYESPSVQILDLSQSGILCQSIGTEHLQEDNTDPWSNI